VRRARDVQEDRGVEDVRPDDLVGAEREDDEQRQPEEDAASDGRQPDDEPAEDADEDRGDLVAVVNVQSGSPSGPSTARGSSR
jgi:hypothetical protein